ncbi:MAG TPA: RidA family protein [Stellaceae bacterium]|nr:RidA family protein [Stellaceae bacterium]
MNTYWRDSDRNSLGEGPCGPFLPLSLDHVKRIVKVLGVINSADGFGDQLKVMNGFSDLMVEVFGEAGRHARSAVGTPRISPGADTPHQTADGVGRATGLQRLSRKIRGAALWEGVSAAGTSL